MSTTQFLLILLFFVGVLFLWMDYICEINKISVLEPRLHDHERMHNLFPKRFKSVRELANG